MVCLECIIRREFVTKRIHSRRGERSFALRLLFRFKRIHEKAGSRVVDLAALSWPSCLLYYVTRYKNSI